MTNRVKSEKLRKLLNVLDVDSVSEKDFLKYEELMKELISNESENLNKIYSIDFEKGENSDIISRFGSYYKDVDNACEVYSSKVFCFILNPSQYRDFLLGIYRGSANIKVSNARLIERESRYWRYDAEYDMDTNQERDVEGVEINASLNLENCVLELDF